MPILEFRCGEGHTTEKLFLTFSAAEGVEEISCPQELAVSGEPVKHGVVICGLPAELIPSVPGHGIFYGAGFYKPAASGKTQYTTADPTKVISDMQKADPNFTKTMRKA
jgi:hypothetical protein